MQWNQSLPRQEGQKQLCNGLPIPSWEDAPVLTALPGTGGATLPLHSVSWA